jgi:hypothetical protein
VPEDSVYSYYTIGTPFVNEARLQKLTEFAKTVDEKPI